MTTERKKATTWQTLEKQFLLKNKQTKFYIAEFNRESVICATKILAAATNAKPAPLPECALPPII